MSDSVRVSSPSRLHFGLLSFGHSEGRQFGGVGVMVARPRWQLETRAAAEFSARGPQADRVSEFARRWARFHGEERPPACEITVRQDVPPHVGLGSGTQLGLAVAVSLHLYTVRPWASAASLAASVGRGLRSAVGTYGFLEGGLVAEPGKRPGEGLAPCGFRGDMPDPWRFVLLRPRGACGLSGQCERTAFTRLPAVPAATSEVLARLIRMELIPAMLAANFEAFSDGLFEYGRLAGECFAAVQGGPYCGPELAALVKQLRDLGVRGVGQSSWGPTLFALLPDQRRAEQLVGQLHGRVAGRVAMEITPPDNWGVVTSRTPAPACASRGGGSA